MAPVVVYSISNCPYCEMAKAALRTAGVRYQEVSLDEPHPKLIERFRADTNNARTVPQILIGGRLIGGWDRLRALTDTPEFQQMIAGD